MGNLSGIVEKFNNTYRIPSARLASWDYSSCGMYFLTICTKNRNHFFGEIIDNEMLLNETGKIANQCWQAIPRHFKFVELGEHIVMPNHVHGIIIINKPFSVAMVETGHALSLQPQPQPTKPPHFRFRNQGKNTISAMVGSFKSATTRLVKSIKPEFNWQTRFYDTLFVQRKILIGFPII